MSAGGDDDVEDPVATNDDPGKKLSVGIFNTGYYL